MDKIIGSIHLYYKTRWLSLTLLQENYMIKLYIYISCIFFTYLPESVN